MGEGWGEGEESRNFNKLFIPLPIIPSRQGRENFTFYEIIKIRIYGIEFDFFLILSTLCVLSALCGEISVRTAP